MICCVAAELKNAYNEAGKHSKTGLHALELQEKMPSAGVVYCSATAVSDAGNMRYMSRTGLWGTCSIILSVIVHIDMDFRYCVNSTVTYCALQSSVLNGGSAVMTCVM